MRPDLFRNPADFISDMERHLEVLRASGPEGSVQLPGEAAARQTEIGLRDGIEIGDVLLGQLRELARRHDVGDRLEST
jgi:LDH2 family malate/lactate/ureidoglycolate dehydrogenase